MLVNLNEVLFKARKEKYAVPAFDSDTNLLLEATLDAAEEMKSPIILQFHESDLEGTRLFYVTSLVHGISDCYSIPIVLHLDHGAHPDKIRRAIDNGFTSVMYDGSHLPLDENIRNTKEIVEYAHNHNVSVEAELGHVGGNDLDLNDTGASSLTDPQDVLRFIAETNIDALAISIGTVHGVYTAEPELNILVLEKIAQVTEIPLVIHGGSGTPNDQLQVAIANGISKVNVFADLRIAFKKGLVEAYNHITRPDPLPYELFGPITVELKDAVKNKILIFGSEGKA